MASNSLYFLIFSSLRLLLISSTQTHTAINQKTLVLPIHKEASTQQKNSIFKDVMKFYANELSSVPRVAPITPFGLCFNSSYVGSSRMGPGVPYIDLVLQKNNVVWRIFGENVVVRVGNEALCLAFVDGGARPRASIVIGGHQLEDSLVQFDLASSRVGLSSSLLFRRTNCGNFNFTPN